jgi:hypothetical protein
LVGLADVEVKEARERVRCAIQNSGLEFPSNKRITVNLAPADLPKDSGRLDLPIALGILAASGQIDAQRLEGHEFAGELSLSGALRPVRGALAMALTLLDAPTPIRLVLPPGSAEEAALVPGATVYRAKHLLDVVRYFAPPGVEVADPQGSAIEDGWWRMEPGIPAAPAALTDMADVKGQAGNRHQDNQHGGDHHPGGVAFVRHGCGNSGSRGIGSRGSGHGGGCRLCRSSGGGSSCRSVSLGFSGSGGRGSSLCWRERGGSQQAQPQCEGDK